MDCTDFFNKVDAHENLEGVGVDEENGTVIVKTVDGYYKTIVPISAIKDGEWDLIEEVLTGKREPVVLTHMTRVVGYFSATKNWNKSKIGELKDRQKGDYVLPSQGESI